jgi:arylformamidase
LISVEPESARETSDTYAVPLNEDERLITRAALENALKRLETRIPALKTGGFYRALVVRTLPNDEGKLARVYLDEIPPFFSHEAMESIVRLGFRHLLVDLPSIDRIYDEGKLANHRNFWNVRPGEFGLHEKSEAGKTITELIYAPDAAADGVYLLNLQIAPFAADASPSRPLLYRLAAQ